MRPGRQTARKKKKKNKGVKVCWAGVAGDCVPSYCAISRTALSLPRQSWRCRFIGSLRVTFFFLEPVCLSALLAVRADQAAHHPGARRPSPRGSSEMCCCDLLTLFGFSLFVWSDGLCFFSLSPHLIKRVGFNSGFFLKKNYIGRWTREDRSRASRLSVDPELFFFFLSRFRSRRAVLLI